MWPCVGFEGLAAPCRPFGAQEMDRRVEGRLASPPMIRRLSLLLLLAGAARAGDAPVPPASNPAALRWFSELRMHYLPEESGFLSVISASEQMTEAHGRMIPVQSQVYYMLLAPSDQRTSISPM